MELFSGKSICERDEDTLRGKQVKVRETESGGRVCEFTSQEMALVMWWTINVRTLETILVQDLMF